MDYAEVLGKSWRIIWKFKWLWLFGLLASCGRASGGGGNGGGGGSSSSGANFDGRLASRLWAGGVHLLHQVTDWWENIPAWAYILLVVAAILLIVLVVVLNSAGRAGLARGAWLADGGEEKLPLGKLWVEMMPYFWRVLGLNLLLAFAAVALVAILVLPAVLFGIATLGIGLILVGIPLICALVILVWLLAVLREQAVVAVVGENAGLIASLRRGWEVIQHNIGPMVVLSLLFFLGGSIAQGLFALPFLVVLIPAAIGFLIGMQVSIGVGLGIGMLFLLAYLPFYLVLTGALQSYIGSGWALAYRRLAK